MSEMSVELIISCIALLFSSISIAIAIATYFDNRKKTSLLYEDNKSNRLDKITKIINEEISRPIYPQDKGSKREIAKYNILKLLNLSNDKMSDIPNLLDDFFENIKDKHKHANLVKQIGEKIK